MMFLQHQLEKEVKKSPEERIATPDQLVDLRHQSIAQIIYEDNRVSGRCQLLNQHRDLCHFALVAIAKSAYDMSMMIRDVTKFEFFDNVRTLNVFNRFEVRRMF